MTRYSTENQKLRIVWTGGLSFVSVTLKVNRKFSFNICFLDTHSNFSWYNLGILTKDRTGNKKQGQKWYLFCIYGSRTLKLHPVLWFPWHIPGLGFAKSRPVAQWPAAHGPEAQSWFSTVFCPAVNPCACTGLHRVSVCKMDDGEFEFVYHYNISILSLFCCMLLREKCFHSLFIRLFTKPESILNDIRYFQTTVWDWKFHIKLSKEICGLQIVTQFMIFSLSKYGLKITYIVR